MKQAYIPNQHGAWAMLAMPFALGAAASGFAGLHLPMFAAWLLVYLFSFPLLQWLKTKKPERYRKPVAVYGALLIPFAVVTLAAVPTLLWFLLPIVPLFLINVHYARTKNERALLNDAAAVLSFCYVVFPVYYAGGGVDWGVAADLFAIALLYFMGTVFYVKTIIRERNNPRYYIASVVYHLVLTAAFAAIEPALAAIAALLLVRAAVLPKLGIGAKQSGMSEIGFSVALLATVLLFYL